MEKRGAISHLFHNIFYMSLTSGVKLRIHLLNEVVRFIVFLTSATLIFRGTDILKCFRESLGIRDNESRLYLMSAICHICLFHFFKRTLIGFITLILVNIVEVRIKGHSLQAFASMSLGI